MPKRKQKGGKGIYPIEVYCSKCQFLLYKYNKEGPGHLVKCYVSGITEDNTGGKLNCPKCGTEFARRVKIRGRDANKIIGNRVTKKGYCGD